MTEVVLESVRAVLMAAILALVAQVGRHHGFARQRGLKFIVGGFALILFGGIIDITDNFEELNRFVVIGNTMVQAILEKLVGYLLGFTILLLGLWQWLPQAAGNVQASLTPSAVSIRQVVVTLVCGVIVSAFAFVVVQQRFEKDARFEVNQHGSHYGYLVQSTISHHTELLRSIAGLYAASETVTREEYSAFARPYLERHPGIEALQWLPRVQHGEREDFVQTAREDGLLDFEVTEEAADGRLIAARQSDVYFPIYYSASLHGHGLTEGLNLAADPSWRDRLDEATVSGSVIAIPNPTQVQDNVHGPLFLSLLPIYADGAVPATKELRRSQLVGFVLGIFSLPKMMEPIWDSLRTDFRFDAFIFDRSEQSGGRLLFAYGAGLEAGLSSEVIVGQEEGAFVYSAAFPVANRIWSFLLRADPAHFRGKTYFSASAAAVVGLLLTFLLAQYLHGLRDRSREIEQIVAERSQELSAANNALEVEMAERQWAEQNLVQMQKMEAMGQLTGGIAHDFNNLLMAIDGYARRAAVKIDEPEVTESCIQEVLKATERANKLTAQLLSFSRRQVMEKRVFRVEQAIVDLKGLLRKSVGENYDMRFEIDAHKCCVETDPGEFGQAILNLVINSRDAMARGGVIIVGAKLVDVDGNLAARHPQIKPGKFVQVYVTDYGEGMYEDVVRRMFEPFYTTKEQGKGTGLGLAMVYGFAQQSNGAIEVDTSPGVGTTIQIYLPVSEHDPQELTAEVDEVHFGDGETVLLVEDDESLLALTRATLEDMGYSVLTATNGLEALEIDEEYDSEIHLLLSDVIMPSLGGFEMSEIIRERRPDMKIVFMSGYPNRGQTKGRSIPERSEFLQKPILPERLAMIIRKTLDSPRVLATA